jgi:Lrp/AsnC family leucine-responsive transcriptional regulator
MLDDADRRILSALQEDARLSNVDLARRVGLSESPCFRRTRALEADGVITGYHAALDRKQLGWTVAAYCLVNLVSHAEEHADAFHRAVAGEPRIVECMLISGSYDYILKVVARSVDDLADLTLKGILQFPNIRDVSTAIVFRELKTDAGVPVEPISIRGPDHPTVRRE